jgi:hypothetical protein
MPYGNLNVDTVTTSTTGGVLGAGNASIMKNRLINGDMRIDQRNAGSAVTNVTSAYVLDRWKAGGSTDGAVTIQQTSTAPDGFTKSMKLLVATADTSIGAAQYYQFFQVIEGYNVADLMLGTATAKTFTVSFWVQSSKTGTYCATITNGASSRLCPVNFTISAANTWEQKSFTVTGDTTGTWTTDNTAGLILIVNLALGSNFNAGTNGTWGTTQYGTSSQVNWMDTVGATFYITGVQLEVGSSATGYEYRQYGQELALCQRYFVKTNPSNVQQGGQLFGAAEATTSFNTAFQFPVSMRAAPTTTLGGTVNFYVAGNNATVTATSIGLTTTPNGMWQEFGSASVTLTVGQPCMFNGQVSISAEL